MGKEEGWKASRGLNGFQRTALAVTLEQLERSVSEIEHTINDIPAGATYSTVVDFESGTLCQIRELCQDIHCQVAEIAAAFKLPQRQLNVRQVITAEMSAAWAHLEDLRPSKLQRYGSVDPILEETLTPRLKQLIGLVLAIDELSRVGE